MRLRRFRLPLLAAAVSVAALAAAPIAYAGPLVSSAASCEDQTLEQPFLPWADVASYVLAPAGTLEGDASAWSLSGDAAVVAGNEPYFVHGQGEESSLSLPAGSSATTAPMCVGIEHPTLRLFVRNAGSPPSTLKVEVLFEDAAGNVQSATLGAVPATAAWGPTPAMPIVVNLLTLLPGERTAVAFRFTPQGAGGAWRIDDVYVDPYSRR
jgi:hypothetical protein